MFRWDPDPAWTPGRRSFATFFLFFAFGLYTAVSAYLIIRGVHHRVLVLLALQYGVILPTTVYYLYHWPGQHERVLMADRWELSEVGISKLVGTIIALQLCQQVVSVPAIVSRSTISRQVRMAIRKSPRLVFLKGPEEFGSFIPKHANWNGPDWRRADHVFLVDPGPSERASWAARLGETSWQAVGYDEDRRAVSITDGFVNVVYTPR
jgi:hypothetical protein